MPQLFCYVFFKLNAIEKFELLNLTLWQQQMVNLLSLLIFEKCPCILEASLFFSNVGRNTFRKSHRTILLRFNTNTAQSKLQVKVKVTQTKNMGMYLTKILIHTKGVWIEWIQ